MNTGNESLFIQNNHPVTACSRNVCLFYARPLAICDLFVKSALPSLQKLNRAKILYFCSKVMPTSFVQLLICGETHYKVLKNTGDVILEKVIASEN